jgi:hypothetical protein
MDFFAKLPATLCCTKRAPQTLAASLDPPGSANLGSVTRLKLRAARLKEMADDAEKLAEDIEKQENLLNIRGQVNQVN